MAITKPVGAVVDAPKLVPAPFGLLNPETLVPDTVRWEGGVAYESLACAAKVELWGQCDPDSSVILDGTGKNRVIDAPSFGITATDTCFSTFGADFRKEALRRTEDLLEASTQKAVESELMWGWIASSADPLGRWLASPDTVIVDSSGVSPKAAMAILEDAYASCSYGDAGVLHMTRGTVSALRHLEIVGPQDAVLRNKIGSLIIAGSGYTPVPGITPPAGWDGTWAFITGPTQVWVGDIEVYPDSLDEAVTVATNDIRFKAERLAAVTYDGCCAFAVKVDLNQA